MASKNKLNKLKNSFMYKTALKNKQMRLKRIMFYTASERKENKKINNEN